VGAALGETIHVCWISHRSPRAAMAAAIGSERLPAAGEYAGFAVSTVLGRCEGVGMRVRVGIALIGSALAAASLGCTSHVASVTLFSTRNVEMSQPHDRLPRAEESDSRLWLAFIPLGSSPNGLRAATDMIEEQNADYLTNIEVTE